MCVYEVYLCIFEYNCVYFCVYYCLLLCIFVYVCIIVSIIVIHTSLAPGAGQWIW
jgi:hypothetical protein